MIPPRAWLAGGLASLVLFALVAADVVAHGQLAQRDEAVGLTVVGLPPFLGLARSMDAVGESEVVIVATLAAGLLLLALRRWWGALRLVGVVGATYAVTTLLKHEVGRLRPPFALEQASGLAFPSGHAASSAALAVLLVWFASRNLRGRPIVVLALALGAAWALLMAFTRMVLGVHYLSDVVGGLALGAAVAALGLAGSVPLERRWPLTPRAPRP